MELELAIVEGFLSYKTRQTIDFRKIKGSCLINGAKDGNLARSNGTGKSSLFEALCINFWGKVGGRSNLIDSYMNHDPETKLMYLEHIFLISGKRFKKTFSKTKTGSAINEIYFDLNDGELEQAEWKLTDETLNQVLGLSSLSFNSTVYISERETLKFIDGTSTQRKEVLRELLNIEIHEIASKKCSKKSNELSKQAETYSNLAKLKQDEIDLEGEEEQSIADFKKDIKFREQKLNEKNEELETSKEKLKKNQIEQQKQQSIKEKIKIHNDQLTELKTQIADKNEEIDKCEDDINQYTEENKTYIENKENTNSNIKQLNIQLEKIKSEKIEEPEAYNDEEDKKQIELIKIKDTECAKKIEESRNKIDSYNTEIKELEKKASSTSTSITAIEKQLNKIKQFGSICPVIDSQCSIITDDYKQKSLLEKNTEKDLLEKQLSINEISVESLKKKIKVEKLGITELETERDNLSDKIEKINDEIEKSNKKYAVTYNEYKDKKNNLTIKIKNKESEIESFKQRLTHLDEQNIRTKKLLEKSKIDFSKVKEEKQKLTEKKNTISKTIEELNVDIKNDLIDIEKELKQLISDNSEQIEKLKKILETDKQNLIERQEKEKRIEKLKKEHKNLLSEIEKFKKEQEVLVALVNIFGKDGIQKTLMKQSVPLLEETANELLKIFNNNSDAIRIRFELDPKNSDGELKKEGGLYILICEEGLPPKDICMYSGGETVRIVFSIIFSLAKLLTKRSGKKHETLIIDEKIAKLDEEGIEQFAEIMKTIYPWYKQVFVITHLSSLKDLLENESEILVNKTSEGSIVEIR